MKEDLGRESDDSIYHFTKKIETMVSIMKQKFVPHYCSEDIGYFLGKEEFLLYYPLVCFCDIPFERHAEHMEIHGKYGIGMKKAWAKKNSCMGIVCYTNEESANAMYLKFLYLFHEWLVKIKIEDSQFRKFENALNILFLLHKPYETPKQRFYDEKEWRYIPFHSETDWSICPLDYKNKESLEKALDEKNRKQEENTLDFSVNDISCIILNKEDEKDVFIESIRESFSKTDINKIRGLIRTNTI